MRGMKKASPMMPKEEMMMAGGMPEREMMMSDMPPEMSRKMKVKKVADALKRKR